MNPDNTASTDARGGVSRPVSGNAFRVWPIVFAILCGLVAAAPLWGAGMINTRGGGDSPFLLQRTLGMAENLAHGIIPPRWMSHAAYDLGYPFFNHYAALPYYLSGGLTLLGLDSLWAIQTTQTLGFVLAALTMALWARRLYRSRASRLLATVAYTFAPFHLVNVYVRGDSLSEFYAFIWYPLILWSLDRLIERPSRRRVFVAALAYGGLILTHNVSALIFSPFALLWGLLALWLRRRSSLGAPDETRASEDPVSEDDGRVRTRPSRHKQPYPMILILVTPFILGFLLTAWFWLPAIAETEYIQMGPEFTAEYFHYSNHFRGANLIQPSLLFNYDVASDLTAVSPFAMGRVQAALTVVGLGILALSLHRSRRREQTISQSAINLTLAASLAIATLMITPLSKPLWDMLPLLEITQFPWRFLSVQALFTAAVTGAIGEALPIQTETADARRRRLGNLARAVLVAACAALTIVASLARLHPERLTITPSDVTNENLLLYESFTGNIGTTIRYEYLPEAVVPRLYISEAVVDSLGAPIADGGVPLEAALVTRRPDRQVWRVSLSNGPTTVAFPLNWWPDWRATVDGAPVDCTPMPGSGRAAVVLPPGEHLVDLTLHPTPLRRIAGWLSGAVVLLIGLAAAWRWVSNRTMSHWRGKSTPTMQQITRSGAVQTLGWIALATILSLVAPVLHRQALARTTGTATPSATFFDFHRMPYPHQGPIDFGAAKLVSAEIGRQRRAIQAARPGEQIDIALTWSQLPTTPLTATVGVASPAEPRHGVDYTLQTVTAVLTPTTHITVDLPHDLSRGLYLLRLTIDGPIAPLTPHTIEGATMGTLYIGALRIQDGPPLPPQEAILAEYRDLTLHSVDVHQETATNLTAHMTWSTKGTPRNWRLSLRLLDSVGNPILHQDGRPVQADHQPGYGYLPTTLWRPDELVRDRALLTLPEGLAPGNYTLRIITYLQAIGEGGGEYDNPIELTRPTLYDIRDACCELTRRGKTIRCQTDDIALLDLTLPRSITEGDDLNLQAEWNALLAPTTDLSARWRVARSDGSVVTESQQPLAIGSRTSEWPRFTWVRSSVLLDLPNQLEPGPHTIELTLMDEHGTVQTCGAVASLTIAPRPRAFEIPDLSSAQTAMFGDTIRLLGYETVVNNQDQTLNLTLWWQAITDPAHDLKRFVHLYDPSTESILAQDDAMPRDWTYPTSWWVAGEVISESITLAIGDIPNGDYQLGIGWYDPTSVTRLPAETGDGVSAPADRITLDQPVTLIHRR